MLFLSKTSRFFLTATCSCSRNPLKLQDFEFRRFALLLKKLYNDNVERYVNQNCLTKKFHVKRNFLRNATFQPSDVVCKKIITCKSKNICCRVETSCYCALLFIRFNSKTTCIWRLGAQNFRIFRIINTYLCSKMCRFRSFCNVMW